MEYTHLSEFALRPGGLTLWHPELRPGRGWAPDDRPLTSVHARYCRETDAGDPRPGRGRWIGTIFELDAPFDAGHWRTTVRLWHARHEGLRTTVDCDGPEPRRLVCAPDAVAVADTPVPAVATPEAIHAYLAEALEIRLSPLVWPHCLLATVEHPETGDFTVLVAADHSVMDAYSQAIVILELRTLYREVTRGEQVRESITFGSPADFAALERSSAAALTPGCEPVRLWQRFLAGSGGMLPRFEPAIAPGSGQPSVLPQTSVSRKLLPLNELELIEEAITARGHRLSVAVFAALAIAYRRAYGYLSLRAIMPIATRPDLQWLESMGWFVNVVPIDITLAPDPDPDSALEATRTALRKSRVANNATWTRALELLDCADRPRFGISFLDIRVLPDYQLVEALRGHTLRSESYSGDEVFFWVVRAADGLRFSTRFPAAFPAAEMDRFLAEFTRAIGEFAGQPPADRVRVVGPDHTSTADSARITTAVAPGSTVSDGLRESAGDPALAGVLLTSTSEFADAGRDAHLAPEHEAGRRPAPAVAVATPALAGAEPGRASRSGVVCDRTGQPGAAPDPGGQGSALRTEAPRVDADAANPVAAQLVSAPAQG
ncbi:condensation domain-containing protein [Nocardia sp. NPDC057668]|uniref:condensation domain-containing protein n=1 Tax=Nocardia sp. NPDC057668 TaxID=3346202 RepID=UPI00366AC728